MSAVIEIVPVSSFIQTEPVTKFFTVSGLQALQDDFTHQTGVASLIMYPNGIAITKPSNFSRLCQIIRRTTKGGKNCTKSDVIIGNSTINGATIQPCKSGGLWDSGVRIHVGNTHLMNWLIGQVMNEEQARNLDKMMYYAHEIGADVDDFSYAISQVTVMDVDTFTALSNALFVFALQLGKFAEQGTDEQLASNHARLKQLVDKQPNIAKVYDVWNNMVTAYRTGTLCV